MTAEIDNVTKRRLIYVKKLFLHGHEHIPYQTEFDRMIAIHHFDNAVELLLKCVATKYDINFRSHHVRFPDLWNEINKKIPLPKKTEMFQLHDLRSNVQHWGLSPFSTAVVNRFDIYVLDFLREVVKEAFELDFEELFMSSLVKDKTLRNIITIAEKAFNVQNYEKCMRFADAALNRALNQQREKHRLFVLPGFEEEPLKMLAEYLELLANRVFVLQLGVDYLKYSKYISLSTNWDEEKENIYYPGSLLDVFGANNRYRELEKKKFSRENALFNLNFVLDCLINWHQ